MTDLQAAMVSILERARCQMLGSTRSEHIPISDVTDELFEGIEVRHMNMIINALQDEVKNS